MPCQNCSCLSCLALAGSPIPPTEFSLLPSELMMTNRAPTDSEAEESKDMIDFAKKRMLLLQEAMADLAEQTTHMIEMHKAVMSPLRNFPSELLVAIFAEYTDTTRDPWPRFTSPTSPLNLTWICSRWRRIVLDTPQFWTRISNSTPMVDLWLTRSRESLLDLNLDLSSGSTNPTLNALIPQAHRWEQVHLTLRLDPNPTLSHVKGHLHSLKRLKVSCLNTVGTLDFFEEAPQLTEIQLDRVTYPPSIRLPWKQLRNCTLDGWLLTLYTLQQAKNTVPFHSIRHQCDP
ncbi:hypothetical protein BD779DRAFT_1681628 [Infundibulicybe gibba]|nr:hypothetical protein BD779DRAFT_1681628 [Infundibulicybe gibba]